jgi:Spy/CpxP family protein refolding chaperone
MSGAVGLGLITLYAVNAPSALAAVTAEVEDEAGGSSGAMGIAHAHEQMQRHIDAMLTKVGASDAQKAQILAVVKDAMTAQHADMEKYHATLAQLKTLLTADAIDDAALGTLRAQQDQLFLSTSQRVSDTVVQVAKILTPAQRQMLGAELDQMMSSAGGHHMMMFHHMG